MHESLAAVWLREGHLRFIVNQSRHCAPNETGGVLMGYTTSKGVVITDVIGAGPNAKHTRSSYAPDLEFDYREISAIYEESGRMHAYVGDWHMHPPVLFGCLVKTRLHSRPLLRARRQEPATR